VVGGALYKVLFAETPARPDITGDASAGPG